MSQRSRSSRRSRTPMTPDKAATQAGSSASSEERAMSPLARSRLEERTEFQRLNDMLAALTKANRLREAEVKTLSVQISSIKESHETELKSLLSNSDDEIKLLRAHLDACSNKEAQMIIERDAALADNKKAQSELIGLKKKLTLLESRRQQSDSENSQMQQEMAELKRELADALSQNEALAKRHEELRRQLSDIDNLKRQLGSSRSNERNLKEELDEWRTRATEAESSVSHLRRELERETEERIKIENRLVTTTDEAQFRQIQMEQRMKTLREQGLLIDETVDSGAPLPGFIQERVDQQLQDLRDEIEDLEIERRTNMQSDYAEREASLQAQLSGFRSQIAELEGIRLELQGRTRNAALEVANMRKELDSAEDAWRRKFEALNRSNEQLLERNRELQQELADFRDEKVRFDAELEVYRTLLEAEEARVGVVHGGESAEGSVGPSRKRARRTLSTRSPVSVRRGGRVARVINDGMSSGVVKIVSQDLTGTYVTLQNMSEEDFKLAGCTLNRKVLNPSGAKDIIYKFAKSAVIKPKCKTTIWSANTGRSNEAPANLVMKAGQNWSVGEELVTELTSGDEQLAKLETRREYVARGDDAVDGKRKKDETCVVM